jgi:cytochrome P450
VSLNDLRLLPLNPAPASSARKNISVPLATPLTLATGDTLVQLPVRENQTVVVAVAGLNRSPALWGTDAAEWRPERWLSDLPESVLRARVPGVYSNL